MQEENLFAISAVAPAPEPETLVREQDLGREEFLQLLIAQLENQDPLNPQDPSQFVSELAQFSNLEQLIAIREGIDSLGGSQQSDSGGLADAASLIGRDVLAIGNRLEFDAGGQGELLFELPRAASEAELELLGADGGVIYQQALSPELLGAGRHRVALQLDGGAPNGAGVYEYRIRAVSGDESLTAIPFISGIATGASALGPDGEAHLRIGSISFPTSDLVEVRAGGSSR